MTSKALFLDGRMIRASDKLVESLTPGVVQGKGVFETMRVCGGAIFALEAHMIRLLQGLKTLNMRMPCSRKQLKKYLDRVIRVNHFKEARLRLAVWKEGRSLRLTIVGQDTVGYSAHKYKKGFKAVISDIQRKKTRFSHIKSMDYGCFRQAFMEARRRKCDEAILLNNCKEIVEGSRTNVFLIKKGVLYTPATRCGCLNGITRQIVISLARQMNISCRAVAVDVRRLQQADEAFVTNSLMGIMPLTVVAGKEIGRGEAGPLTQKLLRAYRSNVHSSCPPQSKSV